MTVQLYTPPRTTLAEIIDDDHPRCSECKKPTVWAWFERRDTPAVDDPWAGPVDEDGTVLTRLQYVVHADGSGPHSQTWHSLNVDGRCRVCKSYSLTSRDTGYGYSTSCRECGWNQYTDSGD